MNDIENKDQVVTQQDAPQEPVEAPAAESDFMSDVEKTLVQIRPGQTLTGTVGANHGGRSLRQHRL